VQHKTFGSAFVRSLHLEAPWINCCVVQFPETYSMPVEVIMAEVSAAGGFTEVVCDFAGGRSMPVVWFLEANRSPDGGVLGGSDVILVSGGGKGIAAECALALARQSGARLAILGRSVPQADAELDRNLERLTSYGVQFRYYVGDVTDENAVL